MYNHIFQWLATKLYPNGRAFRMPEPLNSEDVYVTEDGTSTYTDEAGNPYVTGDSPIQTGGIFYRLTAAIASVQDEALQDALRVLDSAIADNPNFTIEDARMWYNILGIHDSGSVALADMMLAINQGIQYPGDDIYGRSHFSFVTDELQAAGFNVAIYENRFFVSGSWVTKAPADILGAILKIAMHGFIQHGVAQHGQASAHKITKLANYIEESKDLLFNTGADLFSSFYVADPADIATFANVPIDRKDEFRQLLLVLKPQQSVGLLFVDYV